jgi:RNA polymerase primary sigma factor
LLEHEITYVYDHRFDQPDAEATFLSPMPARAHGASLGARLPARMSPYVASLYDEMSLLRPEEEVYLFLRMNYLKYRASKLRETLDPLSARASDLDQIERLQEEARSVKNQIVRACLRLVVSITRKRPRTDRNFFELISDGNLALILAVEKFDASRGFKFSTYASCAIMRYLARTTTQEISRRCRFMTGHQDRFEAFATPSSEEQGGENGEQNTRVAVLRMLDRLSDRERAIIVSRFGLEGAREKTLRQLGEEMGITKERVRQIETRARNKLRQLAREQGLDPTAA